MFELVMTGVGLGFTAGATPGSLHTYLVSETLAKGWRSSIVISFSPLFSDIPIILVTIFLLDQLPDTIIHLFRIVGGFFLIYLARAAWLQRHQSVEAQPISRSQTLGRAMIINWLNPNPWIYWTTVGGPLLLDGLDQSPLHVVAFLAAFYGIFIGFMWGIVFIFDRMRQLDPRLVQSMTTASAIILLLLGLGLLVAGFSSLA